MVLYSISMEHVGYLKAALRAAQNGRETRMLIELDGYYQSKGIPTSKKVGARLYEILEENIAHNVRRDILLGLSTDKNPNFNLTDILRVKLGIQRLIEMRTA